MQTFLIVISLILAAGSAVLAAALFFRVRALAERQEGLLSELEQIAAAQRRVLEQFHGLAHRQRALAEKLSSSPDPETTRERAEANGAHLDPQKVKEDILFLARQGLSAETIARDLNIPSGEVELILDLERFNAGS
ncbi:MAG TPA: hypothetical protein VMX35_08625 [Acidobacteriota bacterium]|nr:hypothetical protein [Acidobacteriota bacterium]